MRNLTQRWQTVGRKSLPLSPQRKHEEVMTLTREIHHFDERGPQ